MYRLRSTPPEWGADHILEYRVSAASSADVLQSGGLVGAKGCGGCFSRASVRVSNGALCNEVRNEARNEVWVVYGAWVVLSRPVPPRRSLVQLSERRQLHPQ